MNYVAAGGMVADKGTGSIPDIHGRTTLSLIDATAIIVGAVVGAGIFRAPSIVAANSGDATTTLFVWVAGGLISFVGALCYAELASAYPHAGGDYHYVTRGFGPMPGFLFAWSRMTVIQTGSIAMLAFVVGDYLSGLYSFGDLSPSLYAASAICLLTGMNYAGIRQGKTAQKVLSLSALLTVTILIVAGLAVSPRPSQAIATESGGSVGRALIFVLLTFGGWNEAAYISSELKDSKRNMVRALVWGLGLITTIYVLVNAAYLRCLGFEGTAGSEAVALDLMRAAWGEGGAAVVGGLVAVAALSAMNAIIITSARTNYAFGQDHKVFRLLGKWEEERQTPGNALLLQGFLCLILVAFGGLSRAGFVTMVEYTAPVFWSFFFLSGAALFRLRLMEPHVERPFKVPFYPLTPLIFCAASLYMLHASLAYTGRGAIVGALVLLAGLPLYLLARLSRPPEATG